MPGRRPADRRAPISTFMRQQHLDPLDVEFGILQVLDLFIFSQQNLEFGAAIQRAINDWQLAFWSEPRAAPEGLDPGRPGRHRSSRSPRSSAAPRSANMCRSTSARAPTSRSAVAAIGRSTTRAQELGLPLGIHVGGYGGHAPTGSGWPSYYVEEHQSQRPHHGGAAHQPRASKAFPSASRTSRSCSSRAASAGCVGHRWRMDQHFEALPQRGAASQAPAIGICARAFLVHDAADRRAG